MRLALKLAAVAVLAALMTVATPKPAAAQGCEASCDEVVFWCDVNGGGLVGPTLIYGTIYAWACFIDGQPAGSGCCWA